MTRHVVSPVLAAIIAAGTAVAVLVALPGDTFRDLEPRPCHTHHATEKCR